MNKERIEKEIRDIETALDWVDNVSTFSRSFAEERLRELKKILKSRNN